RRRDAVVADRRRGIQRAGDQHLLAARRGRAVDVDRGDGRRRRLQRRGLDAVLRGDVSAGGQGQRDESEERDASETKHGDLLEVVVCEHEVRRERERWRPVRGASSRWWKARQRRRYAWPPPWPPVPPAAGVGV